MYIHTISLICLTIFIVAHAQYNDDRDLPPAPYNSGRSLSSTFDAQYTRGRCPERFYQVGDECLYFSTDGKIYSWVEAERVCSRRVSRMLNKHSSSDLNQPNMTPTKGVRAIVLNTPEKTEIFRALFREYNEQNYAVHLPSDYNTLRRCRNAKDDRWPRYCSASQNLNATCFETVSHGPNDICLREVDCRERYLRVACEFTLPGSPEITSSKFRHCPEGRSLRRRLPIWAWILIAVGSALLLLAIIAGILVLIRRSKQPSSPSKRHLPQPRHVPEQRNVREILKSDEQAREPMLIRSSPSNQPTDTGYLQPRSLPIDNSANA